MGIILESEQIWGNQRERKKNKSGSAPGGIEQAMLTTLWRGTTTIRHAEISVFIQH